MTTGLPILLANAAHAFRPYGGASCSSNNCVRGLEPRDAVYRVLLDYNQTLAEILINRCKEKK
eukprot:CAMPEP_0197267442 /NCGR_PEP_ID=MMETSP1432-20130617/3586_1 /TAXON_ID=44447 /ORGANISM="Pseudo-nitzschia delicatissima, Strain UNC1205" /LENGTH=62 /DNA_ID=CAMNT_0042732393 /DNA_START=606 /DNA_END=794 /DNA_ORIENTATION=+